MAQKFFYNKDHLENADDLVGLKDDYSRCTYHHKFAMANLRSIVKPTLFLFLKFQFWSAGMQKHEI